MKNRTAVFRMIVLITVMFSAGSRGDDTVIELRFENRRFTPQTITVPANQSLTIRITNASKEAIEFESFKLNREKVVGPVKRSSCACRLCVREATISTTIFTKTFRWDPSSQSKRLSNLRTRDGEENSNHRGNRNLRLSHNRTIQNDPAH